jgi:hypothetical protein
MSKSWMWEMNDHGKWITNQVRFATKEEAERYGFDLGMRWTAMPEPARAAESDDPVSYRLVDNRLERIEGVE